ncbi:MAG: NosD domain-containing protein, partial [Flavobacteriaceae bacterium]
MKTLLTIICFLHIGFLFAQPRSIDVCSNCETSNLSRALELASKHDTIILKPGTYKEYNVIIDKPITIIGEGEAVIDGENKGEVLKVVSDSVHLEGFKIINVGTSYTSDYAAIRIAKTKHFKIYNVRLEKLFFGIYLENAEHGEVIGNTIIGDAVEEFNSGNGIQLWYCKNIKVIDNRVEQVRDGIYLEFSDNIEIENNISSHNVRYGLHFMFSNNDSYRGNTFENNGAGVAVMFSK